MIARELAQEGDLPLAPQIYLPNFIDEACERKLALGVCLRLLTLADEMWAYGEPTDGMRLEIAEADRLGIPVVRKELPPEEGESGRPPRSRRRGAV